MTLIFGNGYINSPKDSYYKVSKSGYDNAAVFTGEGPFSVTDLSGTKTGGQLAYTFVFARRNDKWQIIHGHTSHAWEN